MLAAIDFDDHPGGKANKIGEVRAKGILATEAQAIELFAAFFRLPTR